ncbi:MAG: hypothetical protein V4441_04195 [Pseudomonadota bacterium]
MSIFKTNIQARISARLRGKPDPVLPAILAVPRDLIDTIPINVV